MQDLEYDAAVPMYIMRQYMVEFLHSRVYSKGHKNILEDFLYQALCTTEYIAMIRANAIIDLLVARPMRWMAGKSADMTDWSPFSMGPVLDTVEQLFERGAHDGSALLDANLFDRKHQSYLFKSVADSQPAFCEYLDHVYTEDTVQSPDKNKKYLQYTEALKELLNPTDETNAKTRALTIKYLQVQCAAGITKMHDTRTVLPEYLTSQDGAKCWDKVAQGHVDTLGTEATNDKFSESVFGVFDRMLKLFHGISREAASGLAQADLIRSHQISYHQIIRSHQIPSVPLPIPLQAVRAKSFWLGDAVLRRKPKEPPAEQAAFGYFYKLPVQEQEALVEYARSTLREQRRVDRAHNAEVATYVKSKVKSSSEEELQALITEFGFGLSFFDRWQAHTFYKIATT